MNKPDLFKRLESAMYLGFRIARNGSNRKITFDEDSSSNAEYISNKIAEYKLEYYFEDVYVGLKETLDTIDRLLDTIDGVSLLSWYNEVIEGENNEI